MLKEKIKFHKRVLLATDILFILLSFYLAYIAVPYFRLIFIPGDELVTLPPLSEYLWILVIILPAWILLLFLFDAYENMRYFTLSQLSRAASLSVLIGLLVLTFVFYIFKVSVVSRLLVLILGFVALLLLVLDRYILRGILNYVYRHPYNIRSVLVIGTRRRAKFIIEKMIKSREFEFNIVGCLSLGNEGIGRSVYANARTVDNVNNLEEIIKSHPIDDVIIAADLREIENPIKLLDLCEDVGIKIHIVPDYQIFDYHYNPKLGKIEVEDFLQIPMLTITSTPTDLIQLYSKRAIDVFVSGFLLIALAPLLLAISVLVKLTSKGAILYRWKVVGLNGREFVSYKFRTMVRNADVIKKELEDLNEMNGPVFKVRNDPRVTKIGKFLRKYSLDELPQLFSVLKGDMSLVGPRPPFRDEVGRFEFWQRRKLSVKPGITCLWQVSGRNQIRDFSDWVKLDLEYIDNWSIWLDMKILLKTIPAVLKGTGA